MLRFIDPTASHHRREFLRITGRWGLSAAGLGALGGGWPLGASETDSLESLATGKSVIFLFLHGGPSQIETFDPKMDAPAEIRSTTGQINTSLPGYRFGGTFPQLAQRADRLLVVRSFRTGDGTHDIKPIVGRNTGGANIGSLYTRVVGTSAPESGMPMNVALFPRAVDPTTQAENNSFGRFTDTGTLGAAYAPFVPGSGGSLQQDMQLQLPRARLDDRRQLLRQLDRIRRSLDHRGELSGTDRLREQALETILGGVAKAFDWRDESPAIVARYDTGPLVRPENISRRWRNYNNYVDNAKSLGKLLLLARRLCQAGCRFVTVTTNFVWDMHSDVNNAGVEEGMQYMGLPLDHAMSALIDDLHRLGLQEQILLVACGEMGRTPKLNARGGRDHWGGLAPLVISGGGLPMGQIIGQSSRDASEPASEPVTLAHLTATVMHTLLDIGRLRTVQGVPDQVLRAATSAAPIA